MRADCCLNMAAGILQLSVSVPTTKAVLARLKTACSPW